MARIELPPGYTTHETRERVAGVEPDLVTRFHWRAERRCHKLNAMIRLPLFRWEVQDIDGRWAVVAMQNVAASPDHWKGRAADG